MPGFSDYEKYDGLGLAELVRKKEVTALELCEEAFQRMDRINPKINAVIYRMEDAARTAAKGPIPQGRTHSPGCLFYARILFSPAIAERTHDQGQQSLPQLRPTQDEMARRYKASGLIVLGRTRNSA